MLGEVSRSHTTHLGKQLKEKDGPGRPTLWQAPWTQHGPVSTSGGRDGSKTDRRFELEQRHPLPQLTRPASAGLDADAGTACNHGDRHEGTTNREDSR
jgi:hypothetical protein